MATVAPSAMARADDLKKLQSQVDQLRERLDFISPMLPLVNFVQDYFQKVECEASMQLLRLQNAQVTQRGRHHRSEDDDVSNAQLETVKWLHFMTDVVMNLHSSSSSGVSGGVERDPHPSELSAFMTGRRLDVLRGGHDAGMNHTLSAPASPMPPPAYASSRMPPSVERPFAAVGVGEVSSSDAGAVGSRAAAYGEYASAPSGYLHNSPHPEHRGPRRAGSGLEAQAQEALPVRKELSLGGASGVPFSRPPGNSPGPNDVVLAEPLAEPGVGRIDGREEGPDGLILGKGSWATAYRQAQGTRRDALRLLCTSTIVTARELGDDNTVISEEHIDECVFIANEMLQTWPHEMWARQPEEAKKFFEARLTALYQRKFGEHKA